MDKYNSKDKLVVFSGDLFFPSNLSTYFEGSQMIKPFNRMNVDISCIGNHDFDHGLKVLKNLIDQTTSPWILSNLVYKSSGKPMLDVNPYHVLESQDFKIGFVGLAERDWLEIMSPQIDLDKIEYISYLDSFKKYS